MINLRERAAIFGILRHLVLAATTAFAVVPFLWMVSVSLKSPGEMFSPRVTPWPTHFYALENYTTAFLRVPMVKFLANGVFVCATILALQIVTAAPCAYSLAKLNFPGKRLLFYLVLGALLVPHQVTAIPLFLALNKVNLISTYAALILPSMVSPLAIFLLRQTFMSVPRDIIDAARLDGCNELTIVWRLLMPLATPAVVAFGIFSVVFHWNDLFWPLIVIHRDSLATPPLGVMYFRSQEAGVDYGPLMAGAVIIATPLITGFLIAQKRFIDGITLGGAR